MAAIIGTLVTVGCTGVGPSVGPFYTKNTVVEMDDLVGVWRAVDEEPSAPLPAGFEKPKPMTLVVSPLRRGVYLITNDELRGTPFPAESGIPNRPLEGTVFRVGKSHFANVTLGREDRDALMREWGVFAITTHWAIKFELRDDELRIYPFEPDESMLFSFGDKPRKPLPFPIVPIEPDPTEQPAGQPKGFVINIDAAPAGVVAGSPEELQRALVRAEADGLFSEENVYRFERVKPGKRGAEEPVKP